MTKPKKIVIPSRPVCEQWNDDDTVCILQCTSGFALQLTQKQYDALVAGIQRIRYEPVEETKKKKKKDKT